MMTLALRHTMNVLRSASVLALAAAALAASATPFRYTLSTVGSGVLNGVSFTNASVVMEALADTSAVIGTGYPAALVSTPMARVTVDGVGSDTFLQPMSVYGQDQSAGFVMGPAETGGIVALCVTDCPALANFDLRFAVGPATGRANLSTRSITTLGGSFRLSSLPVNAMSTFTAQPVPEPATMAALGLGAIVVLRRRKRA